MIPILLVSRSHKENIAYIKKNKEKNHLLFEIKPEGKEFSIKEIKNLIKETSIFHKELRVYFLENFHISSLEAQNAFLKTLEEPPNNTLFILSTDNESRLIPTIVSRTKLVFLGEKKYLSIASSIKDSFNKLLSEKDYKFLSDKVFVPSDKKEIGSILEESVYFFKDRLGSDKKAPSVIKEIVKLKTLLENNNLNPQLTLDHILIFIHKQYTMS
ncbi:hypothetical protein HZA76_01610 [Candidatus Roizmanbacteria bacterium]|nr:hypothetical protein [Candidatus Roizmanbacteria bacterium]